MLYSQPIEIWFPPEGKTSRTEVFQHIFGDHKICESKTPLFEMRITTQGGQKIFGNISHSRKQEILAFSNTFIGVDLESMHRKVSAESILKQFFSPNELEIYYKNEPDERLRYFLKLWTQKEAILKMCGVGISHGLHRFSIEQQNTTMEISGILPEILNGKTFDLYTYECDQKWFVSVAFITRADQERLPPHFWKFADDLKSREPLRSLKLLMSHRHKV